MKFLPDVTVPCEVCKGKRYNRETLEIHYKGKNIADVLDMTVERRPTSSTRSPRCAASWRRSRTSGWATSDSASRPRRSPAARPSASSSPLSSPAAPPGARSTSSTSRRPASPSTTLRVVARAPALVDGGNTVVIIEHHLDVVKNADHIIDLGPWAATKGANRGHRDSRGGRRRQDASPGSTFAPNFAPAVHRRVVAAGTRSA